MMVGCRKKKAERRERSPHLVFKIQMFHQMGTPVQDGRARGMEKLVQVGAISVPVQLDYICLDVVRFFLPTPFMLLIFLASKRILSIVQGRNGFTQSLLPILIV